LKRHSASSKVNKNSVGLGLKKRKKGKSIRGRHSREII